MKLHSPKPLFSPYSPRAYLEVKQSPTHVLLSWILHSPVVGYLTFPDLADCLSTFLYNESSRVAMPHKVKLNQKLSQNEAHLRLLP
jgi:hypothetical protein